MSVAISCCSTKYCVLQVVRNNQISESMREDYEYDTSVEW